MPPLTAEEVFRRVCDGVVAIELPDGMGAGVVLSASGLIATNHHLIEGWSTALVRFRDGSTTRARVVRSYRDPDLAFLQLDEAAARGAAAERRVQDLSRNDFVQMLLNVASAADQFDDELAQEFGARKLGDT